MKRGGRLALGLAAVAIGGGETALLLAHASRGFSAWELVLSLLAGWSFIGSGLAAWSRRPENRTGPLMVLVGLSFLAGLLNAAEQPALHALGAWVRPLHLAVFTHLLLAFPSGRLDSRLARGLVGAVYLDLGILYHAPLVLGEDGVGGTLSRLSFALGAVVFLGASALLVHRWRAGSRAWRRTVAPLLWTGALALALLAVFNADQFFSRPLSAVSMWAFRVAFVTIPFAFLAVLLRIRLARASVAELVVELEEARPSGALRDALARALGDPSLTVAYWLPDQQRYVDLEGQPVELPGDGQGRMATVVEREGRRVAAIVHDRALNDDPGLIRAAGAAAGLALDNERVEAGAYYAVAEGLANIAKHARASTATVILAREHGRLLVRVRDDGVGGADPTRGSGLRGLTDRLQSLGGTLEVDSPPGQGTELRAAIPCA